MKEIIFNNSMREGRTRSRLPSFNKKEVRYIKGWLFSWTADGEKYLCLLRPRGCPQSSKSKSKEYSQHKTPCTGCVSESGDFATLFFLVRQHWGGYCYRHFAANFKAFWLQWSRRLKHRVLLLWSVLPKLWKFGDRSAWISKRVRDSSQSCCPVSPCHQDLRSKLL